MGGGWKKIKRGKALAFRPDGSRLSGNEGTEGEEGPGGGRENGEAGMPPWKGKFSAKERVRCS